MKSFIEVVEVKTAFRHLVPIDDICCVEEKEPGKDDYGGSEEGARINGPSKIYLKHSKLVIRCKDRYEDILLAIEKAREER